MDYLSICAIVKDENSYLPEWIEYHKLIGVERFYIYDNGSKIPIAETLAQDIARGIVHVLPFFGLDRQCEAYFDCIRKCRKTSFWMAFIDVDEFICPKIVEDFRSFLAHFEDYAGVCLNWQMFGSSGHYERPAGLQIENFLMKGNVSFWDNHHIKTIARPMLVSAFPNCHFCSYKWGCFTVNENSQRIDGALSGPISISMAQLNHYVTRSRIEFGEKILRGAPEGKGKDMPFYERINQVCGAVRDESILRFVPALKAALRKRG